MLLGIRITEDQICAFSRGWYVPLLAKEGWYVTVYHASQRWFASMGASGIMNEPPGTTSHHVPFLSSRGPSGRGPGSGERSDQYGCISALLRRPYIPGTGLLCIAG